MKQLAYKKIFIVLTILSAISVAVYYAESTMLHKTYYDFLVWNLFLAWIPFAASIAAYESSKDARRKPLAILLGVVWLLFFPNAPYIITDFMHLTALKHIYTQYGQLSFSYWYDFLIIMLFAWLGLLLGFVSTYQIHLIIHRYFHKMAGWLFIAITSILGGYGILLGRVYRLNSWDVLTDSKQLILTVKNSLTVGSGVYCLLFGLAIAVVYTTLYMLINSKEPYEQRQSS